MYDNPLTQQRKLLGWHAKTGSNLTVKHWENEFLQNHAHLEHIEYFLILFLLLCGNHAKHKQTQNTEWETHSVYLLLFSHLKNHKMGLNIFGFTMPNPTNDNKDRVNIHIASTTVRKWKTYWKRNNMSGHL